MRTRACASSWQTSPSTRRCSRSSSTERCDACSRAGDGRFRTHRLPCVGPPGLSGCSGSTYHYRSRRPEQAVLRKRIREIAESRVRYGDRRIWILLRREGWPINAKRVYGLDKLEGLTTRPKPPRRRVAARMREDRSPAIGPNQIWSMDWMYDQLFDGRRIWVLTMLDIWRRVCPVLRVCRLPRLGK